VDLGAPFVLSWSAANADACVGTEGLRGDLPAVGEVEIAEIVGATRFALSCSGPGGSAAASTTVAIDVPRIALEVDTASVDVDTTVAVTWNVVNATSCEGRDGLPAAQPLAGSAAVPVSVPTTFSLFCTGPGGTASQSVATVINPPVVELEVANAGFVDDVVELDWNVRNADGCSAAIGWSGARPLSGSETVAPIAGSTDFELTCSGPGGSRSTRVTATPRPQVTLVATSPVDFGAFTTLEYEATGADGCEASGAWSGDRPTVGTELVTGLETDSIFELTCRGPGGTRAVAATVEVRSALVSWIPPTDRIDGSSLGTLAGARIYYGPETNPLGNVFEVDDPAATSALVPISGGPGRYLFTVTVVDRMGRESGFSQQVSKTVR
jgi:hypothetical protein